jgi:hypothetical protein
LGILLRSNPQTIHNNIRDNMISIRFEHGCADENFCFACAAPAGGLAGNLLENGIQAAWAKTMIQERAEWRN